MYKFLAFDLETASWTDPVDYKALGISCAAVATDQGFVDLFHHGPRFTAVQAQALVSTLYDYNQRGYTILTWNGAAFDFRVLAEVSGLWAACAVLARQHVDLMFVVTAIKGHFLGLDKAATKLGVTGKLTTVTLKDGTILEGMSGAMAPDLWAKQEYNAVLTYLEQDVMTLQFVAAAAINKGYIPYGRSNKVVLPRRLTVTDMLQVVTQPPRWVTDPVRKEELVAWLR